MFFQTEWLKSFAVTLVSLLSVQMLHHVQHLTTQKAILAIELLCINFICNSYLSQAEVSQRLIMAEEAAKRSSTVQSHGDLARKLKVIGVY